MACCRAHAGDRTVLFLNTPALWPHWPFLPLVRRRPDRTDELGVAFDARAFGLSGLDSTVYRTNLFLLPADLPAFLALPHETFDTVAELAGAGWLVD